jgi:hypothetical protein
MAHTQTWSLATSSRTAGSIAKDDEEGLISAWKRNCP